MMNRLFPLAILGLFFPGLALACGEDNQQEKDKPEETLDLAPSTEVAPLSLTEEQQAD